MSKHHQYLSNIDKEKIKSLFAKKLADVVQLAERFGVSKTRIYQILYED